MESSAGLTDGHHPIRTVTENRTAGTSRPTATDQWPVIPPVPTPTPPPPAAQGPEPPFVTLIPPVAVRTEPYRPPAPAAPAPAGVTVALRARAPRRPMVLPSRADSQVWQPRFAYGAAAVVFAGFLVVALPLWLALYRTVGTPGAQLTFILPLGMMLLGSFLTAVAAWVVIVEMRARVRVLDALGRSGDHEAPEVPGASVFTGLLRPFAQLPAQLGLLAVALCLFVGATIIAF